MVKKILIADIKIDRELKPGDDLSDLVWPANLDEMVPVIIQDYVLIDGLRRIKALEKAGVTEVIAVEPTTLEEAAAALAAAHPVPLDDWERVWQLRQYLHPLIQQRVRQQRIAGGTGKKRHDRWDPTVKMVGARELTHRALGGTKAAQFEKVERVFTEADEKLLEKVRSGKLTPAGAYNLMVRNRRKLIGTVQDPTQQGQVLTAGLRQLTTALLVIQKIGEPVTIPVDELATVTKELRKQRGTLSAIIHQLEEAVNA